MKLKLFTIGLLATIALSQAEAAQKFQQQRQAVQENPKLKQDLAAATADHPDLDVGAHGSNVAAVDDLHGKLGASAAPSGASANHRITDLHATLGHAVGGGAHAANQRAETAAALIQAGQPIHTGITNITALIGAIAGADIHAKIVALNNQLGTTGPDINQRIGALENALGNVRAGGPAGGMGPALPDIEAKLNAVLARLKAGLRANGAVAIVQTGGAAVVGLPAKVAGGGTIDVAVHIENVLNEVGW